MYYFYKSLLNRSTLEVSFPVSLSHAHVACSFGYHMDSSTVLAFQRMKDLSRTVILLHKISYMFNILKLMKTSDSKDGR
jgi:hypothetical protein